MTRRISTPGQFGHDADGRDERPHAARAAINLRLRQIERVLSLDVASGHVVADGVADDGPGRRNDESQFGLGDRPLAVGADPNRLAGIDEPLGRGLQEELGPLGGVDLVVELGGAARFLLAGDLAPLVGDAGGPDLLPVDGGDEDLAAEGLGGETRVDQLASGLDGMPAVQKPGERTNHGIASEVDRNHAPILNGHGNDTPIAANLAELHEETPNLVPRLRLGTQVPRLRLDDDSREAEPRDPGSQAEPGNQGVVSANRLTEQTASHINSPGRERRVRRLDEIGQFRTEWNRRARRGRMRDKPPDHRRDRARPGPDPLRRTRPARGSSSLLHRAGKSALLATRMFPASS